MDLYALVDTSSSMNDTVVLGGRRIRKIDAVKEKLVSIVKGNKFDRIIVYAFNEYIRLVGQPGDVRQVEKLYFSPRGGTRIWDCINAVLDEIPRGKQAGLVCITDGSDRGSRLSYDFVVKQARERNIKLKVIDIEGSLARRFKGRDPVVTPGNVDDINIVVGRMAEKEQKGLESEMPFSAPVLSLVPTGPEDLRIAGRAAKWAVSYVEKLTNLIYRPVPTFIVDEYTVKELIPQDRILDEAEDISLEEIEELHGLLAAVCLTFHTGAFVFLGENVDWEKLGQIYMELSGLKEESIVNLKMCAEVTCGLLWYLRYLRGLEELTDYNRDIIYIPEVSGKKEYLTNVYDNLMAVLGILKKLNGKFGGVTFDNGYFRERDCPQLAVWQKYLPAREFEKLRTCVDEWGYWNKNLNKIITAFEITVQLIFKLLAAYRRQNNPYYNVIKEKHTYGVYKPPSEKRDKRIERILHDSGFPKWFYPANTGMVLICLEKIKERAREIAEDESRYQEIYQKLVTATVIHEHTHAAVREGLDTGLQPNRPSGRLEKSYGKRLRAVDEALAEWSELNYFRNDPEIYRVIYEHASMGQLPSWPYAGALLLERNYAENDYTKFRALVGFLRQGSEDAYKLLKMT